MPSRSFLHALSARRVQSTLDALRATTRAAEREKRAARARAKRRSVTR